jgi:folylpolyglutamate synthase
LEARRAAGVKLDASAVEQMRGWIRRIGYEPSDFDRLNIVHVAGTKGKGTTCAFVNSILNSCKKRLGVPTKIGLYTSPHLVSVRERIRINSEPISEKQFAKYFFDVWEALERSALKDGLDPAVKPAYFRFLTLLSFHVFMQENVDVAVYEVGVGGELDSTNIIVHPAATGITTLGIDHVATLGDTIDQIAWHKAGIFKTGSPAFSVRQLKEAETVLKERAKERAVHLQWVEPVPCLREADIKPAENFQFKNAALAVSLAFTVLKKFNVNLSEVPLSSGVNDRSGGPSSTHLSVTPSPPHDHAAVASEDSSKRSSNKATGHTFDFTSLSKLQNLPQEFIEGLEDVVWRGRCETKVCGNQHYYLDGAHTTESLNIASLWFGKVAQQR